MNTEFQTQVAKELGEDIIDTLSQDTHLGSPETWSEEFRTGLTERTQQLATYVAEYKATTEKAA